ncbi:hypothetical protein BDA99DRAFT_535721 [Phascolomyces articulosus]|uniref:Uncharacterized protein n=1 Tax=Phascolomyces articulosus TaxID=60185 RepID=A0AAD5K3T6_9FUNG|nr:hypothetical protein BDA99DRAFT_535721 [Phascolomyces articulosus]
MLGSSDNSINIQVIMESFDGNLKFDSSVYCLPAVDHVHHTQALLLVTKHLTSIFYQESDTNNTRFWGAEKMNPDNEWFLPQTQAMMVTHFSLPMAIILVISYHSIHPIIRQYNSHYGAKLRSSERKDYDDEKNAKNEGYSRLVISYMRAVYGCPRIQLLIIPRVIPIASKLKESIPLESTTTTTVYLVGHEQMSP